MKFQKCCMWFLIPRINLFFYVILEKEKQKSLFENKTERTIQIVSVAENKHNSYLIQTIRNKTYLKLIIFPVNCCESN